MAKKRKHEQKGEASIPRDQMPLEGSSVISPSPSRDVLIQLKDIIEVKVNTDERLQKLEEKVEKDKSKRKKDLSVLKEDLKEDIKEELICEIKEDLKKELIDKVKQDLKKELIDEVKGELKLEIQKEMQKLENKSMEDFSVFKEDLKKELKEVKEEPVLDNQEEMQSQSRFRLRIMGKVISPVYKGKPIKIYGVGERGDSGGHIEVVLYDGNSPIAPDHHLASVTVELVVVKAEFSDAQGFWSKKDFENSIEKPKKGNQLVQDSRFILAGGRYRHKGVVITDNSNRKDVKLGVMIVGNIKERVLEGVSNPFRVQEAKTEISRGKCKESATDDTAEDLPMCTGQSFSFMTMKKGQAGNRNNQQCVQQQLQQFAMQTSTQAAQHGQGQQHNLPPPMLQNPQQIMYAHTAGNGHVGPGRSAVYSILQQGTTQLENHGQGRQHNIPAREHNFRITQNSSQRTYAQTAGNGPDSQLPVNHLQQQNTTQHGTIQLENHRQDRQHRFPPTEHNFPITQNPSQRTCAQTANGQLLVGHLQQQNTTQQGTTQVCNLPTMQNSSQRAGNGPDGQLLVDHQQQQNSIQQGITQLENHGQCRQYNLPPTLQTCNFPNTQNAPQRTYPQAADGQLLVNHLQQQNTTQQGATQLENHGQGRQHSSPSTEHNFPIMQNPSQRTYAQTAGNGPDGQLLVDHRQQQNTTQQGTTQLENHGQGRQHSSPSTEYNFPIMQNPSQRTYAQTAGNGPDGQLLVDHRQQQNTTQQGTTQLENHGQGQQHSSPSTEHNFPFMQNPSQRTYAQTAGNGPDGQLLVDHQQQQNTTQQGTTQLENHGQGRQHSSPSTERNFPIMQNPSQRTYAQTAGNGPDGQFLVDHQQQNTTQQGTTQLENHGPDPLLKLALTPISEASTTQINPQQHQFSQDQHMGVSESPGEPDPFLDMALSGPALCDDRMEKIFEDLRGDIV